jgi:hypothetical protein
MRTDTLLSVHVATKVFINGNMHCSPDIADIGNSQTFRLSSGRKNYPIFGLKMNFPSI